MLIPNIRKIEAARERQGLSKSGLAKMVGIHPSTYTLILKGKHSYAPTIKRIALAVGMKPHLAWKTSRSG
jgi:DNA-binding XRE family transcriptional regulator